MLESITLRRRRLALLTRLPALSAIIAIQAEKERFRGAQKHRRQLALVRPASKYHHTLEGRDMVNIQGESKSGGEKFDANGKSLDQLNNQFGEGLPMVLTRIYEKYSPVKYDGSASGAPP